MLRRRESLSAAGLFALLWVGTCLTIYWGRKHLPYQLGEVVPSDVKARVSFSFESPTLTDAKRQEARENTPSVYVLNDAVLKRLRQELSEGFTAARSAASFADFQKAAAAQSYAALEERDWQALRTSDEQTRLAVEQQTPQLLGWLRTLRYLNEADADRKNNSGRVLLIDEAGAKQELDAVNVQFVGSETATPDRLLRDLDYSPQGVARFPAEVRPLVRSVLKAGLIRSAPEAGPGPAERIVPLYVYSSEQTKAEQDLRSDETHVPAQFMTYRAGDLIVKAGALDENEMALLNQENDAFWAQIQTNPQALAKHELQQWTTYALVGVLVLGLAGYTWAYQPRIITHTGRCAGVVAVSLLTIVLGKIIVQLGPDRLPEGTVLVVAITAGVLTIVYQQRYAFGAGCVLALMLVVAVNGSYPLFLVLGAAIAVTCFALTDVRRRGKLVETGLLTGAVALAVTFITRLSNPALLYVNVPTGELLQQALHAAGWAGVAGLLSGFVTLGFLPMIESVFGVATSMTLLEWKDPSRPLLRRLALEAPGTYNHSLVVGTLAEAAADAIGGNGLLANVGALYHDIGKMNKPGYFIENQTGPRNLHDQLTPAMSLLIIVGHVKDGLELAREYKVPRVLQPFIAEHHGTTLVEYFYHAANKKAGEDDVEVSEVNFRYPGPKPRSKETAVLMLADSIEAAVRAIPEPTPGRIEGLVHKLTMKRLEDGQFEDADLTLRDLYKAEQAIIKSLLSIYHGRIAYPSGQAERDEHEDEPGTPPTERRTA